MTGEQGPGAVWRRAVNLGTMRRILCARARLQLGHIPYPLCRGRRQPAPECVLPHLAPLLSLTNLLCKDNSHRRAARHPGEAMLEC
jgi:hypothetical protein